MALVDEARRVQERGQLRRAPLYQVEERENYEVLWWRLSAQDTELQSLDQVLNIFGADGWELVLMEPIGTPTRPRYRAVFKRPADLGFSV